MKSSTLLLGLTLTLLPAVSLAETVGIPEWDQIVPRAEWIASGSVARHLEGGFVVSVTESLKGQAPLEVTVGEWNPNIPVGTPIVVCKFPSDLKIGYRLSIGPSPDWLEQVAITVKQRLRLETATSSEEATQIIREMLATGLEEPIFAVTTFASHHRKAADYRELWPDFLRAFRVTRSSRAASFVLQPILEMARAEDVGVLIGLLDREDPVVQRRLLESLRTFTYPKPPIPSKSDAIDYRTVREQLLSWFEANKATLRRRQLPRY